MEQKVKILLGEYAFTVAALQHQVETLSKQLEEMTKDYETLRKDQKSK